MKKINLIFYMFLGAIVSGTVAHLIPASQCGYGIDVIPGVLCLILTLASVILSTLFIAENWDYMK